MKLTVTRDGDVIIETGDRHEAVAVARELRNGAKPAKQRRKKRAELESAEESLSPQLVDAWNWLVNNDTPDGSRPEEMAESLEINPHTAVYRIGQLVKKDLAWKAAPGRYRAGSTR